MGFVSYHENIVERFYDSMPRAPIPRSRAQTPRTREYKSLKGLAQAYKDYVGTSTEERDAREARDILGDPFKRAHNAVSSLVDEYHRDQRPVRERLERWLGHLDALVELENLLDEAASISVDDPEAHARMEALGSRVRHLCAGRADLGPIQQGLAEVAAERTRTFDEKRRRLFRDLEDFARVVDELPGHAEEKRQSRKLVEAIRQIQPQLARDLEFVDALVGVTARVATKWRQFAVHYRTVVLGGEFRPRLSHLNRLLLEPEQERFVSADHSSAFRLSGVSGAGKTIIVLHRALRLAWEQSQRQIVVLTLNRSLANVLRTAAVTLHGDPLPANVSFQSVYDVLMQCLDILRPGHGLRLFDPLSGENLGMSWNDFTNHGGKTAKANVFQDAGVGLLIEELADRTRDRRGALAYLRDEVRYVQSAYASQDRSDYLNSQLEKRTGRSLPLANRQRKAVLRVVAAWEEYLRAGGLCDPDEVAVLVAAELSLRADPNGQRLSSLRARIAFDAILVDECQDVSTLELTFLRRLLRGPTERNAAFFAGDIQQKVTVRKHSFAAAGFTLQGRALRQNFRNTREILAAAYELARAYPARADEPYDAIEPELSRFRGTRPIALVCSPASHYQTIARLVVDRRTTRTAVLSENDVLLSAVLKQAKLDGLAPREILRNEDLYRDPEHALDATGGGLYVGRLAAAKGFEFDTVILADFVLGFVPPRDLPSGEWFRPAATAYSAMTRAREVLLFTYTQDPSPFLLTMGAAIEHRSIIEIDAISQLLLPRPTRAQ